MYIFSLNVNISVTVALFGTLGEQRQGYSQLPYFEMVKKKMIEFLSLDFIFFLCIFWFQYVVTVGQGEKVSVESCLTL